LLLNQDLLGLHLEVNAVVLVSLIASSI
jgi:hypothetical protein